MSTPPAGPMPMPMPGQHQPTPEQIQEMQRRLAEEASKAGMTVPQYIEKLKAEAMRQHQMQQQMQQQHEEAESPSSPQSPGMAVAPGPPNPAALAVASFLKSQELKPRTCLLNEQRKDMFRVKRAIRALQSPAYSKARAKNPLLPEVHDRVTAENTFKLLPLSLLALRVSKMDPHEGHEGHSHGKKKRVKGLWTVRIEPQQEANDDDHYIWMWEGSQWRQKLYAIGALILVLTVVLFPLWPLFMRQGVWYLSMGMLGLIGLFFIMSIFRLILFCITFFAASPGLWLYPNLFEDVGFFDSFRPVWAWHEDPKVAKQKKKAKKQAKQAKAADAANGKTKTKLKAEEIAEEIVEEIIEDSPVAHATGASTLSADDSAPVQRHFHASVEEAEEE